MIVVDTDIIASMTFSTPESAVVTGVYKRDPVWEAPMGWKSGFISILSLYYRKGLITYEEGLDALNFAERLIGSREHKVPAGTVVDAVIHSTCSSYDCEFIVLAERLGIPLITFDDKLIREFPHIATTPHHFLTR